MDRVRWVDAFIVCMTVKGARSQNGELLRLADELYASQGHLDPVSVGEAWSTKRPWNRIWSGTGSREGQLSEQGR